MFILDCGKSSCFYFNTENETYDQITHDDLVSLNIPGLTAGDVLVIEDAHLRSRERNSLAQPFDFDQLVQLKKNAFAMGVEILLFPQMTTPKARKFAGVDKDDLNDVMSIGLYLKRFPHIFKTLKSFAPVSLNSYQGNNAGKWQNRSDLNKDVNAARNQEYKVAGDAISDWIDQNIAVLYDRLDDEHRDMLDLKVKFAGKPKEYIDCNRGRLYSVVATLLTSDGHHRVRADIGKLPYWKYAKEVYFAMTPFHMNGGVVASNVKHHWRRAKSSFRKLTADEPLTAAEHHEFAAARREFDKKLQTIWTTIRQMIVTQPTFTTAY